MQFTLNGLLRPTLKKNRRTIIEYCTEMNKVQEAFSTFIIILLSWNIFTYEYMYIHIHRFN